MSDSQKSEKIKNAMAKLLKIYVTKETHKFAGAWDSSAQILENNLKKRGIKINHKIYYEYKFPDDMQNFEYYQIVQPMYLFCGVYEEYFKDTYDDFNQYLIERFSDIRYDLSAFFRFCTCLALSDSETNEQEFKKTYERILKAKDKIAEKIRQLNPELQKVQYYKNFDFIMGAIYGFAPEEIDFFTKLQYTRKRKLNKHGKYPPVYQWEQSNKILQKLSKDKMFISNFLGYVPEYFLSPETSNKIINAIQRHILNLQTINHKIDRT